MSNGGKALPLAAPSDLVLGVGPVGIRGPYATATPQSRGALVEHGAHSRGRRRRASSRRRHRSPAVCSTSQKLLGSLVDFTTTTAPPVAPSDWLGFFKVSNANWLWQIGDARPRFGTLPASVVCNDQPLGPLPPARQAHPQPYPPDSSPKASSPPRLLASSLFSPLRLAFVWRRICKFLRRNIPRTWMLPPGTSFHRPRRRIDVVGLAFRNRSRAPFGG